MYNSNSTADSDMRHAKIDLAPIPKDLPANHPFKDKKSHEELLKYVQCRLRAGAEARDSEIPRFAQIDKDFAGWIRLSEEDRKRKQKHEETGMPQAIVSNLPLAFVHIDDMMTYFAQTFAPNRGMFYHTGNPEDVDEAKQVVTLMNNHAIYSGYFRQVLRGILSLLKYNRGGYSVLWAREAGPKIQRDDNGTDYVESQIRWQGNKLEALDLYNFLHDPLVPLTELHKDGEFAAVASIRSHYWLQSRAASGVYFNCADALSRNMTSKSCKYYRHPPAESKLDENDATGSGTNWVSILSETSGYALSAGYEIVECYIRLNPEEFGLVKSGSGRNRYEVWRITILNDSYIIEAQYQKNIHGYLPYFLGYLNDDLMESAQRSTAEILRPLQDFASFLMNVHVNSSRSAIWGLTVYDSTMVDLNQIPPGEVNARIPAKPAAAGKDLRQSIWQQKSELDTRQTLRDLEALMGIINQFFPTQSLPSQIASIDRAVTNQVEAVQQGVNRRQQKAARLLDESIFRNVRFAMYYNIIQFQPDADEVTDFYSGKPVKINLESIRNTDLPYIIGQGLKSLDRNTTAQLLQQVIFALIQAPQAAQGIDLLSMINFWTSMMDIDADMNQFKIQQQAPAQGQTPGQPAAGNPINPATNPQNVTAPIYG